RIFGITAAYAFADYRKTLPHVLGRYSLEIPNLFNLYIALSRSSGRGTIRLLRDFDPKKLFKQSH
ncbi:hypothetical protein BYT27DRAFT_7040204, partial [Phlegmacium glaucopus]